ncbi:RraA family protein [Microlunatus elymi]|uniref:Putative 4-hydroxy-4-methyl-2-oxoglutarate aldolase n=1 Tax=Microlunatus elymi TaxID=2596828 RepID=A0A516Q5E2_9ACTN|nr:RraA family protein [Microlunatus elymi]
MERIARFRRAGYGGNVSDALWRCGITDTVLSEAFRPLRQHMLLVGRALPVKLHSLADQGLTPEEAAAQKAAWETKGGHPQKQMMRTVDQRPDGTVLCFDTGRDTQPAHFGEMSCQLAYAHGCRGMLLAGNCRDTEYVLRMPDFPVFSFGTRPNAFGGWTITDVNRPIYLPGHLTHYVRVTAQDFIFADNDGVQLIPGPYVDEVLLQVEDTFAKENAQREQIASGMPIDEVYREFGVL